MLDLLHKKCKLGGYVRGQMPKNANVICDRRLPYITKEIVFSVDTSNENKTFSIT